MEEREQFIEHKEPPEVGRTVIAWGKNGALFEHFKLCLPKGSSIKRPSPKKLIISTDIFELSFSPVCEGNCTWISGEFERLYRKNIWESEKPPDLPLHLELNITVRLKSKALLTAKGVVYYQWLDSFIEEFYFSADKEYFLKSIGWENALTVHMIGSSKGKVGDVEKSNNGIEENAR